MSFRGLLVNRVAVKRPTVTYTKGVSTKTYSTVATNLICSIQYRSAGGYGALRAAEHGHEIVEGWFAAFEYGVNIQTDDELTDERGRVFITKSSPQDMTGRRHHVECALAIIE